jgi:hypothetical protein
MMSLLTDMLWASPAIVVAIFQPHQKSRFSSFGLSIAWRPSHLVFFSLFWGHVFFAFQHNLGTFCRGELLKLSLNFSGQNLK